MEQFVEVKQGHQWNEKDVQRAERRNKRKNIPGLKRERETETESEG